MKNEELDRVADEIAIVGLAGRFPGARDVERFWQNIRDGVESVTFFTDEELLANGTDPALLTDPNFIKAAAILDDIESFDAGFFGFNPREAEILDPQHRLFLELAHEGLEHAGYNPDHYPGLINVYAGVGWTKYLMFHLLQNQALVDSMGALSLGLSNEKDFFATRVAYKLNLKGAAMTVGTACSSSLVAVHLASQALLNGECDIALAGGVAIALPQKQGYMFLEGGINSSDGHCRAFDARGDGAIGGSGGGVVVLKRLEDALADGDVIHAVIKGSALNNDGSQKVGFSAPSVKGQASAIAEALAVAGVEPASIDYVETHGTATTLGDPIEVAALKQAYQEVEQRQSIAIGSVKTNVGHLDAGAGVTGLIKTVMALKNKQIPPSLHFEKPNPQIDFANSPFFVNAELREWKERETPRRAGVSSFGMGGTNVHVVLEEAPEAVESETDRQQHLLVLSAKTATSLETATDNLVAHLQAHPEVPLADVAYTLQAGRRAFNHRRVLVCRDGQEAAALLAARDPKRVLGNENDRSKRPVAFLFAGLGDHYVNMAAELYKTERTFRKHVDKSSELLKPHLGVDLREILYPTQANENPPATQGFDLRKMLRRDTAVDPNAEKLNQISIAHPALFVIEYALGKLLIEWGLRPQAMIGHSLGEYVAACLAGVFSLESALTLVAKRAQLIQGLPGGAMLAVPMAEQELQALLGEGLYMATVNGPAHCVVSGTVEAVAQLEETLKGRGVTSIRVNATHAFHSPQMSQIAETFQQLVASMQPKAPKIPYVSNVTGTWITEQEATDPSYWVRHLCQTVQFADGIRTLCQDENLALLEVGPGQTLSSFVLLNEPADGADRLVLPTIRMNYETRSDSAFLIGTLGQLWLSGVEIDWQGFHKHEQPQRTSLPTYPFERQRYWIEPPRMGVQAAVEAGPMGTASQAAQLQASQKVRDIREAFYVPVWKQAQLSAIGQAIGQASGQSKRYLLFADIYGLGTAIADKLLQQGHEVLTVSAGDSFAKTSETTYTLNPQSRGDYNDLLLDLLATDSVPPTVLHLWSVTSDEVSVTGAAHFEEIQSLGFYSLLYLTQALGKQLVTDPLTIWALSSHLHELGGWEASVPEKATLLGACKVIPQEYPNLTCKSLDMSLPPLGTRQADALVEQLLQELDAGDDNRVIAYRGRQRFVQTYESLPMAEEAPHHLREKGVYFIVGGLGTMGLAIAEHLAAFAQAKLVLTSRSGLPARDTWAQLLSDSQTDNQLARRIQKVQELETLGAEVLVVQADATDEAQMQAAVQKACDHFGTLHGVFYAAGHSDPDAITAISETSPAECTAHFAARVHGLYVLADVLENRNPDFCLLVSSLATVLGGLGFVAPGAAHLFMDAFAAQQQQTSGQTQWLTVDFDLLTPEEIGIAVQQALTTRTPQLVVVKQDLHERMNQWIRMQSASATAAQQGTGGQAALHPRPNLHNPYVEPTNDLEAALADILQDLLGIEQVGIHDNFFQLGGNSLLGTQVVTRIRNAFQIDLPLRVLFDANTVYDLALIVEEALLAELEALDEEEAQRLL